MYTDPDSIVQIHRIQQLSRDLPVQFQLTLFFFEEDGESYKTKKRLLKFNHWISR